MAREGLDCSSRLAKGLLAALMLGLSWFITVCRLFLFLLVVDEALRERDVGRLSFIRGGGGGCSVILEEEEQVA